MNKLFLPLFFLAGLIPVMGSAEVPFISSVDPSGNWYRFDPSVATPITAVLTERKSDFGLRPENTFQVISDFTDKLGFQHIKYQQYFMGVKVEGAQFIVHGEGGLANTGNGRLVRGIQTNPSPAISGQASLQLAKDHLSASGYFWEDPRKEDLIKRIFNDPAASYLPDPELVYTHQAYGQSGDGYVLAWKLDITAEDPVGSKVLFVDALNGSILYVLEGCENGAVTGTAVTRYSLNQTMTTDSINDTTYVMRDDTRGGGIETYNMHTSTNIANSTDFFDADNHWANANAAEDDAAADCHWGMQQSYDYYFLKHGRNSFDGNGALIISYVHHDVNWFNAQWLGGGQYCRFGDGNNNPLTAIDVVGHELTHGVDQFSSNLIYQNESGALDESYADIFGTAIEFYSGDSNASWIIGRSNFALRNMANPKAFGDPDTYKGQNWATGAADNGGVHTNSGVFNYWYYLLSVGGSGVNDKGVSYNLAGIGMDSASAIAYRARVVYLTSTSTYFDAHEATIQSAIDLYTCNSNALSQTAKAWKAVGIGNDTVTNDMALIEMAAPLESSCNLTATEDVTIIFKYTESLCGAPLGPGDNIPVGYRLNGNSVHENFQIPGPISSGAIIQYTFAQKADMSAAGTHEMDVWVGLPHDFFPENDTLFSQKFVKPMLHENDFLVGFENWWLGGDTFYLASLDHSSARAQFLSHNTGLMGLEMTAANPVDPNTQIPFFEIYTDTSQNFIKNPEFVSKVCLCVDASQADSLHLSFDLRQTYALTHFDLTGLDLPQTVSSLKITVDGIQQGKQFHPSTPESDTFQTHFYRLNHLAGTAFELCFESQNLRDKLWDPNPGSEGDYSNLDNIRLNMWGALLGLQEISYSDIKVFPIPTREKLFFELALSQSERVSIRLSDLMGVKVFEKNMTYSPLSNHNWVGLEGIKPGVYFLTVQAGVKNYLKKIIIE